MPDCFAETPDGTLLIANGMQAVLRWDGMQTQAEPAGVIAPATAPTLTGIGVGAIVGTYNAFVRYVDYKDNFSSISPVSANLVPASSEGAITGVSDATPVVVTSPAHGLLSGAWVSISGVGGVDAINTVWEIVVLDGNNFSLVGSVATGTYTGGGVWAAGVSTVLYTGVPLPTEPKVVRRQILRNTDGEATTYYVDIDTTDMIGTTFVSTQTDAELVAGTAVVLVDPNDGRPTASLFTPPPNHKRYLAYHLGRMFAAGEVNYSDGSVLAATGSFSVLGIGTEWTVEMAGRVLYVDGAQAPYEIASVDAANQVLTLTTPYLYPSDAYASYSIRPQPAEAKLVYYTEAGQPESWPPINALPVDDDGDEITGLIRQDSFLYILEERHVYRFTFQADPATDGFIFLASASRGCLNNRCWVQVDSLVYMLDQQGVYAMDGGQAGEPSSQAVQDIFRTNEGPYEINWSAGEFFHAVHYPSQETIRWFVALSGSYLPRHALTFNYRLKRWWIEEYSCPIGASALVRYRSSWLTFLGASANRVLALWQNQLDGVDATAGTVRGRVTAAGLNSLTDSAATFATAGLVGFPVAIVDGRGKGQLRTVSAVSGGKVTVGQPWAVVPDATSVYQLGGVPWRYRSAWFRFADGEQENVRRIEVVFEPCLSPGLMTMRMALDRVGNTVAWSAPYSSADANGVRSQKGSADLVADLTKTTGFVQKRFDGRKEFFIDGPRYVYWDLLGVKNVDDVILYQLTLDGVV